MNEIIITGAGRGLGRELALQLAAPGTRLHLIVRDTKKLMDLLDDIRKKGSVPMIYEADLKETKKLDGLCESLFRNIDFAGCKSLVLINNAATIMPIGMVGNLDNSEIEDQIRVSCVSNLILTNIFIKKTKNVRCERRLINISSGAANKPIAGWGGYCASKAAVNIFYAVIAKEQQKSRTPFKIVSFDPGVMDTEMQEYIRKIPEENFPDLDIFLKYERSGQLRKPAVVATVIKKAYIDNWLAKATFEHVWEYEQD